MGTKEQIRMLNKLNEILADKTLSFGCRVKTHEGGDEIVFAQGLYTVMDKKFVSLITFSQPFDKDKEEFKIIGHPITFTRLISKMPVEVRMFPASDGSHILISPDGHEDILWSTETDNLESQRPKDIKTIYQIFTKK